MSALCTIAPRLGKLLPMLASDKDGEVIATVRAIGRALASAGLDWHDLTAALTEPATLPPSSRDPVGWPEVAAWCLNNGGGRLTAREADFVRDITYRLAVGTEPTRKQAAWLQAIYFRLRGVA